MSERKSTLRDMAIVQNREKLLHNENIDIVERFLLVIGSEKSGKTSIINQILQTEKATSSEPPSTYLLEYKCCKQSGMALIKNVCHVWELGSGTTFVSLLPVIIKSKKPTSVILVLDLLSTEKIVKTVETLLDTLKPILVEFPNNEALSSDEDRTQVQPFPVPLVIIGGKYDVFQNLEPAKKKIICQYLRCLAHILQADLLFYSKNDTKLVKNAQNILFQHAFGTTTNKNIIVTDHNKPLSIPAGHDSVSNIEGSPATSVMQTFNKYKNNLLSSFKQESSLQERMPDDPENDTNFFERSIDNICARKKEELRQVQNESQKKAAAIDLLKVARVPKY